MNIDAPILRKALEHITAHPEEWNQSHWAKRSKSCGTAYCLAGTIVAQQGYEMAFTLGLEHEATSYAFDASTGTSCGIPELAIRELVGPDWDIEAYTAISEQLFIDTRTLPDLWRRAHNLTGGEIEIPEEFL
jgi:hypothetical protein